MVADWEIRISLKNLIASRLLWLMQKQDAPTREPKRVISLTLT